MADTLTVHQRNTLVHRTHLYNQPAGYETDAQGFSAKASVWTGSKFEILPTRPPMDCTENCNQQLLNLVMKNPSWKNRFRRSALSEQLNIESNPPYGFAELEQVEKTMPTFSQVTKLHWHFFNGKCIQKFQADNTDRYQFDWPLATDHGITVSHNPKVIFGIDTEVMDAHLAAVRAHQIVNEKGESHRPYRQLSHKLSKRAATISSIRIKHDPSVIALNLIQDAVVLAHLDNAVKLTPAADLLKIVIMGSPLLELYKKTVFMILVAELTYFPARDDLKTIPVEMIIKSMQQQITDKVIRQFVSSILMGASPSMLDGFAWRSMYLSRDKKKVLENIRALQNTLFQLRPGVNAIDIQTEVETLFKKLLEQFPKHKQPLQSLYDLANDMITDNRHFDKAATVLADCLYTVNYEPALLITRHIWLLADAPLHRRLQQVLKDKLVVPAVPIATIMATQASLVAVDTVMTRAKQFMQESIITDLYNPQVFIDSNPTVRAIMQQQSQWNPIRPEMAVAVGDLSSVQDVNIFCTLNFEDTEKQRQALALSEQGKLNNHGQIIKIRL